ncbi:hypothetical protein EOM09_03760 [bacterium]|nr:hypothetical protein [bacterium]
MKIRKMYYGTMLEGQSKKLKVLDIVLSKMKKDYYSLYVRFLRHLEEYDTSNPNPDDWILNNLCVIHPEAVERSEDFINNVLLVAFDEVTEVGGKTIYLTKSFVK